MHIGLQGVSGVCHPCADHVDGLNQPVGACLVISCSVDVNRPLVWLVRKLRKPCCTLIPSLMWGRLRCRGDKAGFVEGPLPPPPADPFGPPAGAEGAGDGEPLPKVTLYPPKQQCHAETSRGRKAVSVRARRMQAVYTVAERCAFIP